MTTTTNDDRKALADLEQQVRDGNQVDRAEFARLKRRVEDGETLDRMEAEGRTAREARAEVRRNELAKEAAISAAETELRRSAQNLEELYRDAVDALQRLFNGAEAYRDALQQHAERFRAVGIPRYDGGDPPEPEHSYGGGPSLVVSGLTVDRIKHQVTAAHIWLGAAAGEVARSQETHLYPYAKPYLPLDPS
jgi:hypothetical protein